MKRIGNFLFFNNAYKDGIIDSVAVALTTIDYVAIKMCYNSSRKLVIYNGESTCIVDGDPDENMIAFAKAVEDLE